VIEPLPIEPFGLRLVLGGGVRLVSRGEGIPGSTTILIRGAPGTGKTVLGVHLATTIARLLECDVAYGCVEILPPELSAIVEGLDLGPVVESVPFAEPPPEDSVLDGDLTSDDAFRATNTRGDEPRILAGLLDLEDGEEQSRLPAAVDGLLEAATQAGAIPRVVVLDSLSDGYNLGGSVPRALADELCKMAAGAGRVFVLLEETVDSRSSPWCFAVDLVIELTLKESPDHEGALLPWMTIKKNRFGPAEPGPHQLVVRSKVGVFVRPSAWSYLRRWSATSLVPGWNAKATTDRWGEFAERTQLPPFEEATTLVIGSDAKLVHAVTAGLGDRGAPSDSVSVLLRIGGKYAQDKTGAPGLHTVPLWFPLASREELLRRAFVALVEIQRRGFAVGRVIIGDFRDLVGDPNEHNLKRFVIAMSEALRNLRIPVILFQVALMQDAYVSSLADVIIRLEYATTWKATFLKTRSQLYFEVAADSLSAGVDSPQAEALAGIR